MPGGCFLPAQTSLFAWLCAEEGMFQSSIFSAGELTALESEGTSPEAKLGRHRASIHPVPLPKCSQLGRKPLLAEVSKLLTLLPRLRCLSTPLQSSLPVLGPHIPVWQDANPAQLSRRCLCTPAAALAAPGQPVQGSHQKPSSGALTTGHPSQEDS